MIGLPIAVASLAGLSCAAYLAPHALRRTDERRLRRRCRERRALVLTYDDGPGTTLTPALLKVLSTKDARATFFLLGSRAEQAPLVVDQVVAAGHEIGCHGHHHWHPWRVAPARSVADIERGYAALGRWIAHAAIFRPPYGKLNLFSWLALRRRRCRFGWWTIDAGDTHAILPEPEQIAARVRQSGGGVILMHDFDRPHADAAARASFVLATTDLLLQVAEREGFQVQTLGALLSA
ncbi:MAG: polysaccharide deacetylase family protein [Planctomycetota bacterium]